MNDIEITTTQNSTIHYELASVGERGLAFFLDLLILAIGLSLLYCFIYLILDGFPQLLVYVTIVPVFVFYTLFFEVVYNGQSLGKMALKLRVINVDGEKTEFTSYLMRWMFRLLDIYGTLGSVAVLGVTSSTNKQRIGDVLANTVVVSLKKDNRIKLETLLKLNSKEKYVPQYQGVTRLNEDDMLVIKEVLKKQILYPNAAHKKAFDLLVEKITTELNLSTPKNKAEFLRAILKDYIMLTR